MFPRVYIVLLISLFGTLTLFSQSATDPSVSANVLTNRVAIGEFGTFIVEVINGDAQLPARIEAQGLEIIGSGTQFSQQITNGSRTAKNSYYFRFKGDQPGDFEIPSLTLNVRGKQLVTRPIAVTVYERKFDDDSRDATKPYFAKLEVTKETFYVNELVPFSLAAYVRGRNAIGQVVSPQIDNESFVFRGFREVRTDGGTLGNSSAYFSTAVVPSNLFALKAGTHRLGPATIGVNVVDSSSGFGLSAFFQRSITKEMTTNTVNVTVKPLPNGEPISFTGGVGSFEMAATPSTRTVSIGDPISMAFEITGVGNLRTMSAPVFAVPQKGIWKSYEANKTLEDENDSDGFKEGRARFSIVIIPEAKVNAIPPFELSFFDPEQEKYITRKSEPIPISMIERVGSAAPTVIQFPNGGNGGNDSIGYSATTPTPEFNGMLHIATRSPKWIAEADLGQHGTLYFIVQALFSITFFTILGFGIMRMVKEGRFQRSEDTGPTTFAQALKKLPGNGATKHDFYHAVNTALSLWKSEHSDPPEKVEQVINRIKERSDSVLYSGNLSSDTPVGPTEVAEFRTILEKLPRR
ncbi:BatD family protein [Verrucomicrobiales bacterium]|nr:BatD family protein [Verrucomicrobiales bacterium]MDA7926683.1 BatD family protein [Verrucomicrobiales bacterium]